MQLMDCCFLADQRIQCGMEFPNSDGNDINFDNELDMETMMTALHIENTTAENQTETVKKTRNKLDQRPMNKQKRKPTNNKQNQSTSTNTTKVTVPSKGNIKIRTISLKRHKDKRNYYCAMTMKPTPDCRH